jgi:hypothetical protein
MIIASFRVYVQRTRRRLKGNHQRNFCRVNADETLSLLNSSLNKNEFCLKLLQNLYAHVLTEIVRLAKAIMKCAGISIITLDEYSS